MITGDALRAISNCRDIRAHVQAQPYITAIFHCALLDANQESTVNSLHSVCPVDERLYITNPLCTLCELISFVIFGIGSRHRLSLLIATVGLQTQTTKHHSFLSSSR